MDTNLKPKPLRTAIASQVFPPVSGTGAVTEHDAIDAVKNKEVVATATVDVEQPLPEPKIETVTITTEQLNNAIQAAITSATTTEKERYDRDRQAIQAELNQTKNDLATAQNQATAITNVLTTLGHTHPVTDKSSALGMPMVNQLISSKSDRLDGLAKDFHDAIESASSANWVNPNTGRQEVCRDLSEARRLFHRDRSQLRSDVERHAKANGFLRGKGAATLKTDIVPAILDYVSMVMRETHSARYVFWQFPFNKLELGKGPGDTIQVPRLRWITDPAAIADRTLTPGTALATTRQNLTIAAVSLVLDERGLGKNGVTGGEPIAIPEFILATSMINLEVAVNKVLGRDYQAYVDLSIRTLLGATTRIVYNVGSTVNLTPANVTTGKDGTITRGFLNALYAYMQGLQIPTDDSGNYCIWMPPVALFNFKNSIEVIQQYLSKMDIVELTSLFIQSTNNEVFNISGYEGTISGFHIFSSNAAGTGASGTEFVQTTTLGTGATTTRTCLAMGTMAVARAVGLEAEVRHSNDDDFGRLDSLIWKSHEVSGYLDVDPAIAAEQQLRVIQIRVPDAPV